MEVQPISLASSNSYNYGGPTSSYSKPQIVKSELINIQFKIPYQTQNLSKEEKKIT